MSTGSHPTARSVASTLAVLAATAVLGACAGFSPTPADDPGPADGPRLLSCNYTPPPPLVGTGRVLSVRVRMSVDERGNVTHASATRRPGYPASVIEAARRAAMSCRYEPETRNGVAVPFETTRYFSFETNGEERTDRSPTHPPDPRAVP